MNNNDNSYFKGLSDTSAQIQHLRSDIILLTHSFFSDRGFTYIDPPVLHEQIPGKKHEIYLPLYENRYSLNSSNALYMGAYASMLGNVYAISPTFRDEQDSINHLVEFRMLEVEALSITYSELPDFVESFIRYILNELPHMLSVRTNAAFAVRIGRLAAAFQPQRITFESFAQGLTVSESVKWTSSTDPSDIDYILSKYIQVPTFITDYPRKFATWTAKPKSRTVSYAINLLLPETFGELCEGCERTNDTEYLRYKMNCAGIDNLQWYLDAVARIKQPRCGFGIGVDRLVRWITGVPHISDSVVFPRIKEDPICQYP